LLGNYEDISPGCKNCCHESEPCSPFCDFCIKNIKANQPKKDYWKPMSEKWNYYDLR